MIAVYNYLLINLFSFFPQLIKDQLTISDFKFTSERKGNKSF